MKNENYKLAKKYIQQAKDYYKAYQVIENNFPDDFDERDPEVPVFPLENVKYYLIGFSVELGLKAFLLFKGLSIKELKKNKFGHDVYKCYLMAEKSGLCKFFNYKEKIIIKSSLKKFSPLYKKQFFRYPDIKAQDGIVAKLKFSKVSSNGDTILSELIKNDVEDVSSTEVRLKGNLDKNIDRIRKISKDDFDKIWGILKQSKDGLVPIPKGLGQAFKYILDAIEEIILSEESKR